MALIYAGLIVYRFHQLSVCVFEPMSISVEHCIDRIAEALCYVVDAVLVAHIIDEVAGVAVPKLVEAENG